MHSSSSAANFQLNPLGFLRTLKPSSHSQRTQISIASHFCNRRFSHGLKLSGSGDRHGSILGRNLFRGGAMDEDSLDFSSLDDWGLEEESEGVSWGDTYILSSSEDEGSDTELLINPNGDVDLTSIREHLDSTDGTLSLTADRLGVLQKRGKAKRIQPGVLINMGLIAFLAILLLLVDWWSWRIVRLPFADFYLTRPFVISAVVASVAGYLFVPVLDNLKIHQIFRKEGLVMHSTKKGTPTMGGLFFVPIGITVARAIAGFSSIEVSGAVAATIAFSTIGLLDDILSFIKNHNYGLPASIKVIIEVAVGTLFWFWLDSTNISSPYSMFRQPFKIWDGAYAIKLNEIVVASVNDRVGLTLTINWKMLVPLPAPLGLVYLGKHYLFLTAFCFVSMGNGVDLTDGLDGLAGGTAALAFIGMSIAVLPICSDLSIFGVSMAGACVGFLFHNRYKASVFMGDTGSLALGGALAAMAACTGMFFPLFISSGIFVLEAFSVVLQVSYFKTTKCLYGSGRRLFRMAPLHHHLELCGLKEPLIVTGGYVVSCMLAIFAGYVGLISA